MAIGWGSRRVKALGELVLRFGGGVTLVLYNENLMGVESFLKSGEIGIWGKTVSRCFWLGGQAGFLPGGYRFYGYSPMYKALSSSRHLR